jgi:hypothetical protein
MVKNSSRERILKVSMVIARMLFGLVREMAPVVLFFFIAFGLIGLLYKLFVSQYAIEFSAFSKAAVAALIIGKVVLLLDWAQSGLWLSRYPRALGIFCKTIVYALAVVIVGMGERIVHSMREAGSLQAGISALIANANFDRFLGLVLLVSLIVGLYLVVQEISRAMGKGALFRLFFSPPLETSRPR